MSLWDWLFCVALTTWASYQLWRAKRLGKISARFSDFTRSAQPLAFWFVVVIYAGSVILFGGAMLLDAAQALGRRPG